MQFSVAINGDFVLLTKSTTRLKNIKPDFVARMI